MSTLSIYVGESMISVLDYSSPSDFKFANYPYSFPYELFPQDNVSEKFYQQVLKYLSKIHGISADSAEVIVGTVSGVAPKIKHTHGYSIHQALSSLKNYSWTLVENFTVMTQKNMSAFYPMKKDLTFSQPAMTNYLSNKSLYPQIVPSSPDTFKSEDVLTKHLMSSIDTSVVSDIPLIFTGGRFAHFDTNKTASYLLALDLLRTPGLFNVKIDPENKLPTIALLNNHLVSNANKAATKNSKETVAFLSDDLLSVNNTEVFDDEFVSIGSVLNAPGGVECLFEVEAGNNQFVEIKANRLFIFPLERTSSARIVVDGKSVGHLDTNIRGGSLGFIIDTRDKTSEDFMTTSSTQHSEWVKIINERIKAF